MTAAELIDLSAATLRIIAFILLYVLIGFGPGYIVGVLLANMIVAKNNPSRLEKHKEAIQQAAEHNKQWHPNDPRWRKE